MSEQITLDGKQYEAERLREGEDTFLLIREIPSATGKTLEEKVDELSGKVDQLLAGQAEISTKVEAVSLGTVTETKSAV